MSIEFKLPELGENIESGDIVNVLVQEGQMIAANDGVFELETDKAVVEIPCPHAGKITRIHVKKGDTVSVDLRERMSKIRRTIAAQMVKSATTIPQIARQLRALAERARAAEFTIEELRGGTFTISNLGAIGGSYSTPIINHPEVAILLGPGKKQVGQT